MPYMRPPGMLAANKYPQFGDAFCWLDAAEPSTITDGGANDCSQWRDKSKNAFVFNGPGVSAQRPSTGLVTANGRNCLHWGGATNKNLSIPSGFFAIGGQAFTMFVVAKIDTAFNSFSAMVCFGQTSTNRHILFRNNAEILAARNNTAASNATMNTSFANGMHIYGMIRNGSNITPFADGVMGTPQAQAADYTIGNLGYLGNLTTLDNSWNNGICEIVYMPGARPQWFIDQCFEYSRRKWATP